MPGSARKLFELERLSVVVQQHIDSVAAEGRVIGIKIDDLKVSPFSHRTATLEVEQRIRDVAGTATGVGRSARPIWSPVSSTPTTWPTWR